MISNLVDPRRSGPASGLGERAMLEGWLEFHRTTLLLKCEGLDRVQLRHRPVASSLLSLHGLVRHMADAEHLWFTRVLLSSGETRWPFCTPCEDREFVPLDDADWDRDLASWHEECELSRDNAARFSLDDTGQWSGPERSLRWIYSHMVEEYARHNGHADLIRELVDGAVGC
ncbi:MAG: DinB family protein [Acidimicrobiaceae bacterium]|nr:DinB family protein [Acidimicrobiaceae bacterium]